MRMKCTLTCSVLGTRVQLAILTVGHCSRCMRSCSTAQCSCAALWLHKGTVADLEWGC
jgi:hypothetical protein